MGREQTAEFLKDVLRGIYVTADVHRRRALYNKQMKAYEEFMAQHHDVVDYIASLASRSRKQIQPPSEELVFDTLRRLNGVFIMGELGAGRETLEATLYLKTAVRTAAYKHAQIIGREPVGYVSGLEPELGERFIVL